MKKKDLEYVLYKLSSELDYVPTHKEKCLIEFTLGRPRLSSILVLKNNDWVEGEKLFVTICPSARIVIKKVRKGYRISIYPVHSKIRNILDVAEADINVIEQIDKLSADYFLPSIRPFLPVDTHKTLDVFLTYLRDYVCNDEITIEGVRKYFLEVWDSTPSDVYFPKRIFEHLEDWETIQEEVNLTKIEFFRKEEDATKWLSTALKHLFKSY